MTSGTVLIVVIAGILAVLSGWLLPLAFKSRRPFGLAGDIAVCLVATVVLAYVEWVWLLPAIGFGKGWIAVAAAIGDPLILGWICLWLMRKIKK
jgi:hypothetical protein